MNRRSSASAGLAHWSAARGRNALRRIRLMSTVGALVGVSVFAVLQLLPREADRALRARVAALPLPIDTTALQWLLVRARDSARVRQERLLTLQQRRQRDSMFVVSVTDAAGVPRVMVGDTLRAQLAEQLRLARATPIVEGFLSLAAAPALAADSLAQLLADSLRDAERERGAFAALGGPDLRYRALQDRVAALGGRLVERAELRLRNDFRDDLALAPPSLPPSDPSQPLNPAQPLEPSPPADTAFDVAQRALRIATDSVAQLETSVRRASAWNTARAEQERALRAAEPIRVPMLPMLLAVCTIAASVAYVTAFAVEWRRPRIADEDEVKALVQRAGVDATVVIEEQTSGDPPRRRAVDRALPVVLRRDARAYERLHQQLSMIGNAVSTVGVISQDADHTAAAAVQLAAAAAEASRAVLLIDADATRRRVAGTVGYATAAGLADVARNRIELASVLVTVNTGRDHGITLLPAGQDFTPHAGLTALAAELQRLMQRHDVSVIALAGDASSWPVQLSPRDIVIAVVPGLTRVAWLSEALRSASRANQTVRGVLVLFNTSR